LNQARLLFFERLLVFVCCFERALSPFASPWALDENHWWDLIEIAFPYFNGLKSPIEINFHADFSAEKSDWESWW
jgi:hypothetical protein